MITQKEFLIKKYIILTESASLPASGGNVTMYNLGAEMGSDTFNNGRATVHSSAQCTTLKYALVTSAEKCERLSLGKRPLSRFVAVSRAAASRKFNPII